METRSDNDNSVRINIDEIPDLEMRCPVCQQLADKKCSACHKISYCSSEHQKRHWKLHKNDCKSFTVKKNEIYGRYLVATRDLSQGTIIFTEEPLTFGPKRCTPPVCLGCHKRLQDGNYCCSKCTYPLCSEECEKEPIHAENECLIFQRATHPVGSKISNFDSICPAYECITPLRCLLLKDRDPAKWEKLITMEHHNDLRRTVPGLWNRNYVNVVKLLLDWYKMKEEPFGLDEETIHSVMGYIDVNCFEIRFRDVEICGVYRDAGLMSHDCVPNTHNAISIFSNHKMFVRSSTPIRKGEMITTSYTDQLTGTRERQGVLKDTKYFDCFCERCLDPAEFATYLSGVKCGECATGYQLPKNPTSGEGSCEWVCSNAKACSEDKLNNNHHNPHESHHKAHYCRKSMKDEQVQTILKKVGRDIEEVSSSTSGSTISRLERLLKKYSGKVLHPNHYLLLSVIRRLNSAYAKSIGEDSVAAVVEAAPSEIPFAPDMDHLKRAKTLSLQLLGVLDMIDPGLTRLRGVTLFQLSISDFHISRMNFHDGLISQSEYKENIEKILAYLKTSREIMELDKMVTPSAVLYGKILDQLRRIKEVAVSLA